MDLTGVVGLAGLIAVIVGVSILSIASMTLSSGIASTANGTIVRKILLGTGPDGTEELRDINWFISDNSNARELRKKLSRYPYYLLTFYFLVSAPLLGFFAALGLGQAEIAQSADGSLVIALASDASNWAKLLFNATLIEFFLASAALYCAYVVFVLIYFKCRLYYLYGSLESIMVEDRARVLGGRPEE